MKAFEVYYNTVGRSGKRAVVLSENEQALEYYLSEKDEGFNIGRKYCNIESKTEIPLSNVMVKDLSVIELLMLLDKNSILNRG
jgi:hypothetical protein